MVAVHGDQIAFRAGKHGAVLFVHVEVADETAVSRFPQNIPVPAGHFPFRFREEFRKIGAVRGTEIRDAERWNPVEIRRCRRSP